MKTALLAGATGLIGKQLLDLLLNDGTYLQVKALTRAPLEQTHPKLENIVVNFDSLETSHSRLKADDVFCCLGTTMKKAGSKDAFRKVDFTYPFELAKLTKAEGASQYHLVSALGADKTASFYYNKVKGEIEEAVSKVGFSSCHIYRPSLLLGPREENRSGEDAAKVFYKVFGFIIPQKYKAIDSYKVAKAMIHFATEDKPGVFIHESKELQAY